MNKLLAWLLGAFAQQRHNRIEVIERAIKADDWLVYCASSHGSMSFDTWWTCAKFYEGVVKRFAAYQPGARMPLKPEVGDVLKKMLEREGATLYIDSTTHTLERYK